MNEKNRPKLKKKKKKIEMDEKVKVPEICVIGRWVFNNEKHERVVKMQVEEDDLQKQNPKTLEYYCKWRLKMMHMNTI